MKSKRISAGLCAFLMLTANVPVAAGLAAAQSMTAFAEDTAETVSISDDDMHLVIAPDIVYVGSAPKDAQILEDWAIEGFTYNGLTFSVYCKYYVENAKKYILEAEKTMIDSYGGDSTEVNIPAYLGGAPVTIIGKQSFNKTSVTKVTMPDTVQEFRSGAFAECRALKDLYFPKDLEVIGQEALVNIGVTDIVLPDKVMTLDVKAFCGSETLNTISLPESLETIGNQCFYGCTNLTEVNIPGKVTTVPDWCFRSCESLKSVDLSKADSLKTIGELAFCDCRSLEEITLPDSVEIPLSTT